MRRLRSCSSKGVSLLEALIATALMLVVLVVSASLIQDYSRALRASRGSDYLLEAALVALSRMGQEATEAVEFIDPPPGSLAAASRLTFSRIEPEVARLPDPVPDPPPPNWDHQEPAVEIRYFVNANHRLIREVVDGGAVVESCEVAEAVKGLAVTNETDGTLTLEILVDTGRVNRALTSRTYLPLRRAP